MRLALGLSLLTGRLEEGGGGGDPWTIGPWEGTRDGSTVSETEDDPVRARVTSAGSTIAMARKITGLTEGEDYRAVVTFRGGTASNFFIRCGTDPALGTFDKNFNKSAGDAGTTQNLDFTAPAGDYYVGIVATVSGAGDYAECDKDVSFGLGA